MTRIRYRCLSRSVSTLGDLRSRGLRNAFAGFMRTVRGVEFPLSPTSERLVGVIRPGGEDRRPMGRPHHPQKPYQQEFKREAVELLRTSGRPTAARAFSASVTSLSRWRFRIDFSFASRPTFASFSVRPAECTPGVPADGDRFAASCDSRERWWRRRKRAAGGVRCGAVARDRSRDRAGGAGAADSATPGPARGAGRGSTAGTFSTISASTDLSVSAIDGSQVSRRSVDGSSKRRTESGCR